ncbi:hypothetical protein PGT21_011396 [Puccinia graminis f. sp. tritici]|uniref:Secreted protein n=1 Tax=Puccinia graminis f. sp. tritici TaxID=56615 RepID=A0A5B0LKC9_PUCGR|nr:hypothetical protein PGT21_012440 [Puccinia graminis f. sp. tritici]KAA1085569.1 hypothetical protein PGT21_011396 [Puccinia graminis f. sp. tritici]KAA1135979.1 hypothetical protein PGTUg99_015266 [Puccinia graminis f. sp. tritici]
MRVIVLLMTITAASVPAAYVRPTDQICALCMNNDDLAYPTETTLNPSDPHTVWRICNTIKNANTNCGGLVQGKDYRCHRCGHLAFFPIKNCSGCNKSHSHWYHKEQTSWGGTSNQ